MYNSFNAFKHPMVFCRLLCIKARRQIQAMTRGQERAWDLIKSHLRIMGLVPSRYSPENHYFKFQIGEMEKRAPGCLVYIGDQHLPI